MEPTREERREVAERLREAAVDDGHIGRPYGQQGFQVTLRRIIGTSNPNRPTLYTRLADLIDPTCHVDVNKHGRAYCTNCGCDDWCLADGSPYCPNCGARVMDE